MDSSNPLSSSSRIIRSTLSGCCMDSGQINGTILKENLKQAIDVYMNHVNRSPCGDTVIQLFKGAVLVSLSNTESHLRYF